MKYYQITVTLKDVKRKVYRNFLVKPDTTLYDFGQSIVFSFHGVLEHYFLYCSYEEDVYIQDEEWNEMDSDNDSTCYDYKKVDVKFLAKNYPDLDFTYDTGEGYDFKIEFSDMVDVKDEDELNRDVILTKAKGYGIFEDNHYLLDIFLSSNSTLRAAIETLKEEYEEDDFYTPIGLELDLDATVEDYYKSITGDDLEELNCCI